MKKMKIYIWLGILFMTGLLAFNSHAVTFINGLEDVPVMEGLSQIPNDSITFGNEESRLVEAILTSDKLKFAQVEKFYKETLPQMGWKCQKENSRLITFYREGEVLEMVRESVSPLKIRITVKSRS